VGGVAVLAPPGWVKIKRYPPTAPVRWWRI